MKKSFILLALWSSCITCSADLSDSIHKKNENSRIIKTLEMLNNIDIKKSYCFDKEKNKYTYDFAEERKLFDSIDNPMELAKIIVISSYMAYPGSVDTLAIDRHFYQASISNMKRFKKHSHFTKSMKFIEASIKLDAGISYEFSEVIWDARDIEEVKVEFSKRINQWSESIKKHEAKEQKMLPKDN